MHLWALTKWKKYYNAHIKCRQGLRTRFDSDIDPDLREACLRFCRWVRQEYFFPIRVNMYFKKAKYIKAKDGDMVSATFLGPYDKMSEPYIRVATGDYIELKAHYGRDDAIASILHSIAHELSHYFQWVNGIELTAIGEERQATNYAYIIMDEYKDTCDHP